MARFPLVLINGVVRELPASETPKSPNGASFAEAWGDGATAGVGGTALGYGASTDSGVAVGSNAVGADSGIAVGPSTTIADYGIGIGTQAIVSAGGIGIGYNVEAATNQFVFGSRYAEGFISEAVFNKSAHTSTLSDVTLRGTNGSGTNVGGNSLKLRGGRSTGNATPGKVILQGTSAGSSGTTLQTVVDVLTVTSGTAIDLASGVTVTMSSGRITGLSLPSGSSDATTKGYVDTVASGKQDADGDLTSLAAASGTNTIYYRSAASTWSAVTMGTGLGFSGGTLSLPQDLRTTAGPTFYTFALSGAGPSFSMNDTGGGTDQKFFRFLASSNFVSIQGINDAFSLANDWFKFNRDSGSYTLDSLEIGGSIKLPNVGDGLFLKVGTNATFGRATLSAGTVTVSTTKASTTMEVILSRRTAGGTLGHLSIGTITAGTSFVINSSSATDTSDVSWIIVERA